MRTIYALSVLLPTLLTGAAEASPLAHAGIGSGTMATTAATSVCGEPRIAKGTANFNEGMIFYVRGDMDRAVAAYDEAIRLNPAMSAAYDGRGHALQAKGDMDGALANFDEASRLRLIERVEWLAGRSPHQPLSSEEGAVALVAL